MLGHELVEVPFNRFLLAFAHEFINPWVLGSGLDRCLRGHGVSNGHPV